MRFPLIAFAELDSTNSEAARRGGAGERGPVWIMADRQTSGRGRQGRVWQGDPANLAVTLLLATDQAPAQAAQIAFVAALAAGDLAAAFAAPSAVTLKWPNDVLIDGAKVCGVLVETGASLDGGRWMAVGIGANLAVAPTDTPYPAASLAAYGSPPSREAALDVLDQAFAWWLDVWRADGFEPVREAWTARAYGLGRPASVVVSGDRVSGLIEGLDADGALLLRCDQGTLKRITAGDVILGAA
jgi:BirA family biotin operon repressor/biotin-[acetyl-CoA-carboxylase] ligase